MADQFEYESLSDHLTTDGLTLEIAIPTGGKIVARERAWCSTLIGAMAWFSSQRGATFVWRGQRDSNWAIQPRLNRHVAKILAGLTLEDVLAEEQKILEHVRHQGWHRRESFEMRPLELFAYLQHHGVPTRMLDVTRDPLVAAFFSSAVGSNPEREPAGAVVAIRVPSATVRSTEAAASSLVEAAVFEPSDAPYALWDPPSFDSRIVTQRGQFLVPNVGSAADPADPLYAPTSVLGIGIANAKGEYRGRNINAFFQGYLEPARQGRPSEKPIDVAMILVPPEMKAPLREYLAALGLTDLTIYPDQAGYASSFPPS